MNFKLRQGMMSISINVAAHSKYGYYDTHVNKTTKTERSVQ